MTKPNHSQVSATWSQVNAFRLAQHHLIEKAKKKDLLSVTDDMTGVQAQLLSAAQMSLGVRVDGLRVEDVKDAIDKKKLVKASCMRNTLFLVPANQLAVYAHARTRRAEKEIAWAIKKGISQKVIEKTIDATLNVLSEPLTRTEIAERVTKVLGLQKQDVHGGGWGSRKKIAAVPVGHINYPVVYLLHVAASRGVICYGPYQDNEPTFVRADAWLPKWKDISSKEAEKMLLQKYLHAYGPATQADFAMWSGFSLTEAREIWAREESNLITVNVGAHKTVLLETDFKKLEKASIDEQPHVRLLPYFDTYLLGHKDRQHLVDKKNHSKIYRPQGWVSPVVLVDGRVAGIWKQELAKDKLLITVEKFGSMSKNVMDKIKEEAQNVGFFLGISKVKIKITTG